MSAIIRETNLNFNSLTKRAKTDMIVLHHTGGSDIDGLGVKTYLDRILRKKYNESMRLHSMFLMLETVLLDF